MERLTQIVDKGKAKYEDPGVHEEEFGLDCHDLSLENVFVDAEDHNKIVSDFILFSLISYSRATDLCHRLGINNNATALAMCPPSRLPPIQSFHRKALPSYCCRNRLETLLDATHTEANR